jgi:WD40 repeat protein
MYFAATDPSTLDINLYDSENFSLIGTLRGHEEHVYVLRFGVNNTKLATAENYAINVWDIQSMSLANNMKCPCAVGYMVFDGNGDSVLIAGCAGWFFILKWNLTTGSVDLVIDIVGMEYSVEACYISSDTQILSASFDEVVVWDSSTGDKLHSSGSVGSKINGIAVSPDEATIAIARDDNIVSVYVINTSQQTKLLRGHKEMVLCVCYSGDGGRLASGSRDLTPIIWDLARGTIVAILQCRASVVDVSLNSDGTKIVWESSTEAEVHSIQENSNSLLLELPRYGRGQFSKPGVILL